MSAVLIKKNVGYNSPNSCEYQLLTAADVSQLPGTDKIAIGSVAYLSDMSKIWILGEDNTWHTV